MWNEAHVKHWIQWAVKEFNLTGVDSGQFNLTGKELCNLQHEVHINYHSIFPFIICWILFHVKEFQSVAIGIKSVAQFKVHGTTFLEGKIVWK